MDDPVAWSVAGVAIIAALSTAIVNIIVALRTKQAVNESHTSLSEKIGEVQQQTNGALATITEKLAISEAENVVLRESQPKESSCE